MEPTGNLNQLNIKKDWDMKLQTSAQKEIRYAHDKNMEEVGSSFMKQNPKQFRSYIKIIRQDSTVVSFFIDKDGYLHN